MSEPQRYLAVFDHTDDSGYSAWVPDLPGCVAAELRLPPGLISVTGAGSGESIEADIREAALAADALAAEPDLAVEFERVAPASGNLAVRGQQFWFGPDLAGAQGPGGAASACCQGFDWLARRAWTQAACGEVFDG